MAIIRYYTQYFNIPRFHHSMGLRAVSITAFVAKAKLGAQGQNSTRRRKMTDEI
jgi:hypothetical protein